MANIVRIDPFAEMEALQRQFFGDDWFAPLNRLPATPTDVYTEDGKQMVIEAHLPNFDEKDVDISLENNVLQIQAEKHEQEEDKGKKYVVRESSSSFYRRIRLPEQADASKITAHMDNGVLKVVIPFKALPAPKKVTITAGKAKK